MKKYTGYKADEKLVEKWEQEDDNILKKWQADVIPPIYPSMMSSNLNYQPYSWGETNNSQGSVVVFFGFNGLLPQKYAVVNNMSPEEITARLQFAGDKVPYSIKEHDNFMIVVDQMRDTPNMLSEIDFDDAMNIIRIGIEKTKVEEFVDAEKDEFDDNCNEACKPGDHKCGK